MLVRLRDYVFSARLLVDLAGGALLGSRSSFSTPSSASCFSSALSTDSCLSLPVSIDSCFSLPVSAVGDAGLPRSSLVTAAAAATIRVTSLSSPFQALQLKHFHRPTSPSDFTPGGACPLTRWQFEQISAKRLMGLFSSSPSIRSMIRSYHADLATPASGAYCGGVASAFGANSAVKSSDVGEKPGEGLAGDGAKACAWSDGDTGD